MESSLVVNQEALYHCLVVFLRHLWWASTILVIYLWQVDYSLVVNPEALYPWLVTRPLGLCSKLLISQSLLSLAGGLILIVNFVNLDLYPWLVMYALNLSGDRNFFLLPSNLSLITQNTFACPHQIDIIAQGWTRFEWLLPLPISHPIS